MNLLSQLASYFMTYHTPLATSYDFTKALKNARIISTRIEDTLNMYLPNSDNSKAQVFPYSFFYVFYEQYLTIWSQAVTSMLAALGAIFFVTLVFFAFNVVASAVIVYVIASITINLLGLMYLWDISFCAVSLVNIVMVRSCVCLFAFRKLSNS